MRDAIHADRILLPTRCRSPSVGHARVLGDHMMLLRVHVMPDMGSILLYSNEVGPILLHWDHVLRQHGCILSVALVILCWTEAISGIYAVYAAHD